MVAAVGGAGLGVERGSGYVLGSRGQLGDAGYNRYGENVTVSYTGTQLTRITTASGD